VPCADYITEGYRVLARPCASQAATVLSNDPQLFCAVSDGFDVSQLNFVGTPRIARSGSTFEGCLTLCDSAACTLAGPWLGRSLSYQICYSKWTAGWAGGIQRFVLKEVTGEGWVWGQVPGTNFSSASE